MKEHEIQCNKCSSIWYVTNKDIRESKRAKRDMFITKPNPLVPYTLKKYRRRAEQRAQVKVSYIDPFKCPNCGSKDVIKSYELPNKDIPLTNKTLTLLLTIFMPYIGIFLLVKNKPFSEKVNRYLLIYSVGMILALVYMVFNQLA